MFQAESAAMVLVDVQDALAQIMFERSRLLTNLTKIVKGMQLLKVPVIWVEQNPRRLGPTVPEISALLEGSSPISKMSFSCCGSNDFVKVLNALKHTQIVVAGIETHVCIYQTARDLVRLGCEVEVVGDATSSRTPECHALGLDRIRQCDVAVTTVETILLEMVRTAESPLFKELLKIIK